MPRFGDVARFHMVTKGLCWVRVGQSVEPVRMECGDLIVIPFGAEHDLLDTPETPALDLDEVIQRAEYKGKGALVWGPEPASEPTTMVCGHFSFDPDRGRLLRDALPVFIHVPRNETLNYGWLDEAMKFIAYEANADQPGGEAIVNRLSEIIFIQTIRHFSSTSSHQKKGLFAALSDAQLNKAIEAIHRNPAFPWTVDELARIAGTSRTLFAERMKDSLGVSPIAYLTQWRMNLAHEELVGTRTGVAEIAERVGYQSLSAFSRAFKKQFGRGPGEVRRM